MQFEMKTLTRQSVLLEVNLRWLRQALRLVDRVDDTAYVATRTGAHLRHIIEFYRCFLDGIECSHVEYDARQRDETIERSRTAAADALRSTMRAMENCRALRGEAIVWVRVEDADGYAIREPFVESSISRELMALSSHTIHHFALIAMSLRFRGIETEPDFGMSPSTLRYQASRSAEAA